MSGSTLTVPYTGGNGGAYPVGTPITASSGTVTGLTLTLQAGNLANGAGSLVYTISGTPSGVGNAVFSLAFGGQVCSTATVTSTAAPSVATLTCTATQSGTLTVGQAASGVTFTVPYTGGNGAAYNAGAGIASTGVTGLTATLVAGTLSNGSGTLTYNVTGTPSGSGLATFNLTFGGANCAGASVNVLNSSSSTSAFADNFAFGGLSSDGQQSYAVCSDGSVLSQGHNSTGQLGTGNTSSTVNGAMSSFNMVGFNSTNKAIGVAGGGFVSYILRADGTVWAAGNSVFGALGNNSTVNTANNTPLQVHGPGNVGFLNNITSITGGNFCGYAIKSDGTAWSWGNNPTGNLGNGNTTDQATPVQIVGVGGSGFLNGVTLIASNLYGGGYSGACAVRNDGSAYCWGNNTFGQIGDASNIATSSPKQVRGQFGAGNLSNVKSIAVSTYSACAVLNDGTVYAWGDNTEGQLGQNTGTGSNITPLQVKGIGGVGFLTGIVDVKAYSFGFVALKNDGTVYAWGNNESGQCGDNTLTQRNAPVQVLGVGGTGFLTGITAIQSSYGLIGALGSNGIIYGWGNNNVAALAPTTNSNQATPVALTNFCTQQ